MAAPDAVILHYTDMLSAEGALDRLCDPAAEVSAHYLLAEDGRIWALVPESERAWHAGAGFWAGSRDLNSRSVGIEIANPGHGCGFAPFPWPQMRALEGLLGGILERWSIPPERVLAHSDLAPRRKRDPGPRFDWSGLALRGLSIWPEAARDPAPGAALEDWTPFLRAAARFGYEVDGGADREADLGAHGRGASALGAHGPAPSAAELLTVFRLRFRPQAGASPADSRDLAIMEELAERWPGFSACGKS